MRRIHALEVALKDRPKPFQLVVFCLFALSLTTIVFSGVAALQAAPKPTAAKATKRDKPAPGQPTYASFSSLKR